MSEIPEINYSEWQKKWIEARTPKPPEGLTLLQKAYFDHAVKKIRFIPTPEGGLNTDFSQLSREEMFAIGELGTPDWPLLIPTEVDLKSNILRRQMHQNGIAHTFPADPAQRQQFLELERKTMVGLADDKASLKMALEIARIASRKKGTLKLREKGENNRIRVREQAIDICSKTPLRKIKKESVASEITDKLGGQPGHARILKLLGEIFPGGEWPPTSLPK